MYACIDMCMCVHGLCINACQCVYVQVCVHLCACVYGGLDRHAGQRLTHIHSIVMVYSIVKVGYFLRLTYSHSRNAVCKSRIPSLASVCMVQIVDSTSHLPVAMAVT